MFKKKSPDILYRLLHFVEKSLVRTSRYMSEEIYYPSLIQHLHNMQCVCVYKNKIIMNIFTSNKPVFFFTLQTKYPPPFQSFQSFMIHVNVIFSLFSFFFVIWFRDILILFTYKIQANVKQRHIEYTLLYSNIFDTYFLYNQNSFFFFKIQVFINIKTSQ